MSPGSRSLMRLGITGLVRVGQRKVCDGVLCKGAGPALGGKRTLPISRFWRIAKVEVEPSLSLLFAVIAQAVASVPPEKIDLTIRQPCKAQVTSGDEIVVCARRNDGISPYRINQPLPRQSNVPKAELQLADGLSASAEAENADVGGFSSNRAMVRLKIKF